MQGPPKSSLVARFFDQFPAGRLFHRLTHFQRSGGNLDQGSVDTGAKIANQTNMLRRRASSPCCVRRASRPSSTPSRTIMP